MSVNMSFTINATTATEISQGIRELAAILDASARETGIRESAPAPSTTNSAPTPAPAPVVEQAPAQSAALRLDEPSASAPAQPAAPATPAPTPTPSVSLETVRAKLTALVQAGKQPQVRELLDSFGAAKLSDVPPERYAELLEKAGALG